MDTNAQFGSVLSIVAEIGKLDLQENANAALTCKDATNYVESKIHEYPQLTRRPSPGPHSCTKVYPFQECTSVSRATFAIDGPFPTLLEQLFAATVSQKGIKTWDVCQPWMRGASMGCVISPACLGFRALSHPIKPATISNRTSS